jgi:transposase
MSIPGIGPIISLALFSHIGYFDRFSKAKQVSNYVGLTPRVDQSGNTEKKGKISKRGCRQIRRVIVQGAWSFVRSKKDNSLKEMFERICASRGKYIAITAVARAMIEILFHMVKRQQYFYGIKQADVFKKLRYYDIMDC